MTFKSKQEKIDIIKLASATLLNSVNATRKLRNTQNYEAVLATLEIDFVVV